MSAVMVLSPATQRRFWAKVCENPETGCWEWTASTNSRGYGLASVGGGEVMLAHRVSYLLHIGPIDDTVDHTCHNKRCVNPHHLEAVGRDENVKRAWRDGLIKDSWLGAINRQKTECKRGHPLAGDNLYTDPAGHRYCRTCKRDADRKRLARLRAEQTEPRPAAVSS